MKKIMIFVVACCVIYNTHSQISQVNESKINNSDTLTSATFEIYGDFHYVNNFNNPAENKRLYSSNPLNSKGFGLSYAYIQEQIRKENAGVTIALNTGQIVELMYASEPDLYKWIRQASVDYEFKKTNKVEIGILPAIFGAESFINKENICATRAPMTDFAPDFMSGVRYSHNYTKKVKGMYEVSNGW